MSLGAWPARKMAAGGMAEVYLAQQRGLAGFERLVVVKRIRRELNQDPRFVDLFLAEARLAAQLRHPNVVEIYDIIREDEDYFIVMDYLAGEDLRTITKAALAKSTYIPVEIASRIIADIAAGLAYAHEARDLSGTPLNVVHRDVSPSNIIVTYAGVSDLIDFGIAEANSHHIYTRPDRLRGKLAYSSPEQVSHEPVDPQSDVFSLGAVFYELLTMRRLFRGDSPASVVKAVMEHEIAPPSSINPAVPPAVDAVVLRALQRDRGERTESAKAFLEELETALSATQLSVGNEKVAAWMEANLQSQHERRRRFENSIASEPPGGLLAASESTSASLIAGHDLSGSHSGRGSRVPAEPKKKSNTVAWVLGVLGIVALFALAFYLGIQPDSAEPSASGFLVHATPPEARLLVDGEVVAEAVGAGVALEARPGEQLDIRLQLEGFREHREEIIASEDRRELFFNLTAETEAAAVVTTTGEEMRESPSEATATPSQPITASRSRPTRPNMFRGNMARPNMTVVEPPAVEEPSEAVLTVRSTPSGAQVTIDGRSRGSSPLRGLRLEPGREHTIELRREGHRTWTTRVTPVPGDNPDITAFLEVIPPDPPRVAVAPRMTAPTPDPVTEPAPRRDLTVPSRLVGNAARGASLVANRCTACHPGGIRGGSRSASAWSRYFATGRHGRHAMLGDSFSRGQLADVKAHLMESAAGVERQSVGGVR